MFTRILPFLAVTITLPLSLELLMLLPLSTWSTFWKATRQHAAAWALAKVGDPYAQDFQAMRESS